MSSQGCHGLYIASMDHSPSEQLTGENWHTTALIMSPGVEHAELANRLAVRLRPKTGKLMKWKKSSPAYRACFLSLFLEELYASPSVCVFAISAQEQTLKSCAPHFIRELNLDRHYRRIEAPNGKVRIEIGRLLNASTGDQFSISLSENRAIMCLFIVHFVLRIKRRMHEAANFVGQPTHINWNFFGDKFPGVPCAEMDLMFQALTSFDRDTGRILWGYFLDSDTVETDLLADNLAGALNRSMQLPQKPLNAAKGLSSSGLFHWEQWNDD